jgi:hypothetical protein
MRPTATTVVALALAVVVCACGSGGASTSRTAGAPATGTTSSAGETGATAGNSSTAGSSRSTSTSSAAAHPQGTAQAAARRFAAAYAQVLLGQRAVASLPLSSSGVLSEAAQVSRPPAPLHTRAITVGAVTGAGNSWATQLQLVTARGHQSVSADVTVKATPQGWEVVSLLPPDFDQVLAPNPPAPPPSGPGAVRAAATAFLRGYLAFTYGQAKASAIRDVSANLRRSLVDSPPQVPASVRSLHPRIAALALTRQGRGWVASANTTDGQNTYQVIVVLAEHGGRWVAVSLKIN